jgi:hypothetical protein
MVAKTPESEGRQGWKQFLIDMEYKNLAIGFPSANIA